MKRLLALLLTICMVASFGSSYAAAEETEPDTKTEATNTEPTIDEKDSNNEFNINSTKYTLQDSTLSVWNTSMNKFNCYAYALGKNDKFYYPGYFSKQTYDGRYSIDKVANLVVDDLKSTNFHYGCIKKQSSRPSYVDDRTNIIAVRKVESSNNTINSDFHFAKLTKKGWYHKPGSSGILKFNNDPSNLVPWTNEGYNGSPYAPTTIYNSEIRYILFCINHNRISWTGQHYHSDNKHYFKYTYNCTVCGKSGSYWSSKVCSGPPCALPSGIVQSPELF